MNRYLYYDGIGTRMIAGVGTFNRDVPRMRVSDSIANQFNTAEMEEMGWHVFSQDMVEAIDPPIVTETDTAAE